MHIERLIQRHCLDCGPENLQGEKVCPQRSHSTGRSARRSWRFCRFRPYEFQRRTCRSTHRRRGVSTDNSCFPSFIVKMLVNSLLIGLSAWAWPQSLVCQDLEQRVGRNSMPSSLPVSFSTHPNICALRYSWKGLRTDTHTQPKMIYCFANIWHAAKRACFRHIRIR